MEIRKANLEDAAAIKIIADLLYLDIPGFNFNEESFIGDYIRRGEYYVAEENGKIIGIMSVRERDGRLYIETLAVAGDIQSKGVGSKLVEFAKQIAKESGFKILRVASFYEYGVKDFYIKHGFRLLDEPGEYGGHNFHRLDFEL